MTAFTLADLAARIAERSGAAVGDSYTAALLAKGLPHVARKFGEEAVEAVVAATSGDAAALRAEAADVLYHLLVLLQAGKVPLAEVMAELQRRTAQSGHAEKAGRSKGA
ncbi:MAG: phosphoribosyl-ATP diphosphatase [Bauldia sp.]